MVSVHPVGHRKVRTVAPLVKHRKVGHTHSRLRKHSDALGIFFTRALAIARAAQARHLELADQMAGCGNDSLAQLFRRLERSEADHVFRLATKSVGVPMPPAAPVQYAWLDYGMPLPDALAFVATTMTPRLALHIALLAEERGKAYFDTVRAESDNAYLRELATECARDKVTHVGWLEEALADLPHPSSPNEQRAGGATIEQCM